MLRKKIIESFFKLYKNIFHITFNSFNSFLIHLNKIHFKKYTNNFKYN